MSKVFFILGPSGVGKGTTIEILKKRHKEWFFPTSVTTRKKRPGENDGEVYDFVSKEKFELMLENEELLEFAKVHDSAYYGTKKHPILDALEEDKTVIREIDIQGFKKAKKILEKDHFESIFLDIEDFSILEKRIKGRSKISDEEIKKRFKSAKKEIAQSQICDHIIKSNGNEGIEYFANKIEEIIQKDKKI